MYLHLPMTMGIAAVGAAIVNVVEQAGELWPPEVRWLLVAAIAIVLVSIALLMRTIQVTEENRPIHRSAGRVLFLSSFVILLLGFTNVSTVPLLMVLILLMLAPVFYGFKIWLDMLAPEASTPT